MRPRTPLVAGGVAVLAMLVGCKDERRPSSNTPQVTRVVSDAAAAPTAVAGAPKWSVTVTGTPGERIVEGASGPLLVGEDGSVAVVASSVIGFAGIHVANGTTAWQHRGETRPGPAMRFRNQLWLAGRCDGVGGAPQDPALLVVGCATVVAPTSGAIARRVWISLPAAWTSGALASPRGALGMSESGLLLWFTGGDVWSVDRSSGKAMAVCGRKDADAAPIRGAFIHGDSVFVLWSDAVGACSFAATARGRIEPTWQHPLPEGVAAGAAGPLLVEDRLVWIRDEVLEARRQDGSAPWTAEGRFAHCPTCLTATKQVRAIRLDAAVTAGRATMAPSTIDAISGKVTTAAGTLSAPQVLAAAGDVVVVRADTSLRNDWVRNISSVASTDGGWQIPPPATRRVAPVGVTAVDGDVLVFFDGTHLVRLPAAAAAPVSPAH